MWTDLRLVEQFGGHLECEANGQSVMDLLIRGLLKIRVKKGGVRYLKLNRAQQEYSRRCGKRNIVLKARQVGITTYIAARFFIQTITRPGTLTVQVAHNDESAQAIFNIVHRFLGEPAQFAGEERSAGEVALQRPPDCFSQSRQRVPGGNSG